MPEHLRRYLLHDQDAKDQPLRALLTPVGQPDPFVPSDARQGVVRQSSRDAAWDYFRQRREERRRWETNPPPTEDDAVTSDPSVVRFDAVDGHPQLSNDYPAPITVDGETFPSVEHAYWTLATVDPASRDRISHATTAREARNLGQRAPLRADWQVVRLAVMTRLVRAKFRQHPDLAAVLLATGDGRLINGVEFSRYWAARGRNWLGRILELVRAELVEDGGA